MTMRFHPTYMFVFHCAEYLKRYGSLQPFQMENIERLNYRNKMRCYRVSNKGNKKNSIVDPVFT